MGDSEIEPVADKHGEGRFPPTHWTVVMGAGKDSSPGARDAFGQLYGAYRPPLLAYLRRQGRTKTDAEDLTQGFFEWLLENRSLGKVRKEGKFRNWLLVCLKHHLSDLWDKGRAAKRGGGQSPVALVGTTAEQAVDPPDPERTPDEEYEHEYAIRFLELVIARLEREFQARGKAQIFTRLCPFLLDKKSTLSHAELGRQIGISELAVSAEISRMRKRYRAIFEEDLLKLVGSREEMEEEKRFLFASLSR